MSDTGSRMDLKQIETFLEASRHAIASVLDSKGTPRSSPVWFLYQDDQIYFSISIESAKYRHLCRDPRIALCIDAGHPDARAVTINGTAKLITDAETDHAEIEWKIMRRYHESDEEARRTQSMFAEQGPSALVVVSPEKIAGWDYN